MSNEAVEDLTKAGKARVVVDDVDKKVGKWKRRQGASRGRDAAESLLMLRNKVIPQCSEDEAAKLVTCIEDTNKELAEAQRLILASPRRSPEMQKYKVQAQEIAERGDAMRQQLQNINETLAETRVDGVDGVDGVDEVAPIRNGDAKTSEVIVEVAMNTAESAACGEGGNEGDLLQRITKEVSAREKAEAEVAQLKRRLKGEQAVAESNVKLMEDAVHRMVQQVSRMAEELGEAEGREEDLKIQNTNLRRRLTQATKR